MTRFFIALEKRHDRRERISRPKKSINFNLDNNMVREFRITEVVQRDDAVIRSAERNTPKTAGRLVKLNDGRKDEDNQLSDDDVSVANTEATNAQNEGAPA